MNSGSMELRYFIMRRTLLLVPTVVGITVLAFIFLRTFPDSVLLADFINPLSVSSGSSNYDVLLAKAKIELGFNYPVPVQYFYFILNLLRGNWGYTTSPMRGPVITIIGLLWPNTAQLLIFTLVISTLIGVPLGTIAGAKPNSGTDAVTRVITLIGYAMPQFFLGLLLIVIFGKGFLHWPGAVFPIFGMVSVPIPPPAWLYNQNIGYIVSSPTHMIFFDSLINRDPQVALSALEHLALPVATLTYAILAMIVRTLRAGMIDISKQQFIRTAMAKGVSKRVIVRTHTRRNALIPTITVIGVTMGYLMTGLIVVETLFAYQGLGWLIAQSVLDFQVYTIIYASLLFGFFMVISTLAADVIYAYIDPRIRY